MRKIAVILAGGRSRRMGTDKALATIHGKRLIDLVRARLEPQVDKLLISGSQGYDTGLIAISDLEDAPAGPAGGLYSICMYLQKHEPDVIGFFTSPVDAPYTPSDLINRLGDGERSAIVSDGTNEHPTFAYWRCDDLRKAFITYEHSRSLSLKRLAQLCAARRIIWKDDMSLININTLDDLNNFNIDYAK